MNYKNGRVAKLNDRVVAIHPSGKFIGTVSAFEGDHLRVHPLFCSNAFYVQPAEALLQDDALRSDSQVPQLAVPAPVASAPEPAAAPATPGAMKPAEAAALKATAEEPAKS